MLSIPHTHTHTHMNIRHNCGDGITGVCICPNSSNIIYWVFYINYAIIKLVKKRILRQLIEKTEFKFICKVFHSLTLQPLHTYLITSFLCPFSHFVSLALSHAPVPSFLCLHISAWNSLICFLLMNTHVHYYINQNLRLQKLAHDPVSDLASLCFNVMLFIPP